MFTFPIIKHQNLTLFKILLENHSYLLKLGVRVTFVDQGSNNPRDKLDK